MFAWISRCQMRAARDVAERASAATVAGLRSKLSAAVAEEARLRGHSEALEQVPAVLFAPSNPCHPHRD